MTNDVAILILDRNITNIKPIMVSFDPVGINVKTWVRGWGTTSSSGSQSKVLKEVSLMTWDNAKAAPALKSNNFDSSRFPSTLHDTNPLVLDSA